MDEATKERLRAAAVDVLLAMRRQYLQGGSAKPLTQWDILSDRMRAAARTTDSVPEWGTRILRDLQIQAPDKWTSSALRHLAILVQTLPSGAGALLDLVEREHGYLIAAARLAVETKRAERAAERAELNELAASLGANGDDR